MAGFPFRRLRDEFGIEAVVSLVRAVNYDCAPLGSRSSPLSSCTRWTRHPPGHRASPQDEAEEDWTLDAAKQERSNGSHDV